MPAERTPQVVLTEEGPMLLPGPVELVLPDGRRVTSSRPVTALCMCRRSRRLPFCDTSHRTKVRATREAATPGDIAPGDAAPGDTAPEEQDPC